MSLRLCLVLALAAAGCAKQAPQVRAPRPVFDLSRICDDPNYGAVCTETQSPSVLPGAVPAALPIRVDTNLAAPPTVKLAFQG